MLGWFKQRILRSLYGKPIDQSALNAIAVELFQEIAEEAGVSGQFLKPNHYDREFVIESAPGFDQSISLALDLDEIRFFAGESEWYFMWFPQSSWGEFKESAIGFLKGDLQVVEVRSPGGKFLEATLRPRGDDGLKAKRKVTGHYTLGASWASGVPRIEIWRKELPSAD